MIYLSCVSSKIVIELMQFFGSGFYLLQIREGKKKKKNS